MNQYDLVASPMTTAFVKGAPAKANFAPFTHVKNLVPLDQGVTAAAKPANAMEKAWRQARVEMFKDKMTQPDSQDPDTLSHLNWYEATGFERPYPGEASVRPPSDFKTANVKSDEDGDGDED
jgi:hypothetical protein